MSDGAEALAQLRATRDALMRPDAPFTVNLREYVPDDSPGWRAFVRARRVPGYSVRRATMVGWLEEVIAQLEAETDAPSRPVADWGPDIEPWVRARPPDSAPASVAEPPTDAPPPPGTPLRRLTAAGIAEAQAFLARLREHPDADRTPPDDLLFGERYSRPFEAGAGIAVEPRAFRTRRAAGEYLSPLLAPVRRQILDDAGVWSWLGMYYLAETVREKGGQVQITYDEEFLFLQENWSAQHRSHHRLWAAWLLYEQYGESVAVVLGESITFRSRLTDRILTNRRVFNSVGVVPLVHRLYTNGKRTKRNYAESPGGLRHLMRVLPQLELTYDVYGMRPEALLRVLPDDFRHWDARTA